ncbi:MAG: dehydrogenase, partial [Francisellaceae bacterium]|nr:dehydrogenase [Francisellaceae bacterium]
LGSNIYIHVRRNQVMRVVPRENETINEVWLSDRDRFGYTGLLEERICVPKIKKAGHWTSVSWEEALEFTQKILKNQADLDPMDMAFLAHSNCTLEEFYLIQKLARALGTNNIDHRVHQLDFRQQDKVPYFPQLNIKINELETLDALLLIGSNIRHEQPLASLRLRKMVLNGGLISCINPIDFDFNFDIKAKHIVPGGNILGGLAGLAKAILNQNPTTIPLGLHELLLNIQPSLMDETLELALRGSGHKLILLGNIVLSHPLSSDIIALAEMIASMLDAKLGFMTEGANQTGAWIAGCLPHRKAGGEPLDRPGKNVQEMIDSCLKTYCLFNLDPNFDCINNLGLLKALQNCEKLIVFSAFKNEQVEALADIILPIAPFSENAGTYVNIEGRWQSFTNAVLPLENAKPLWKILKVLARLLGIDDFNYQTIDEVLYEIRTMVKKEGEMDNTFKRWFPESIPKASEQALIRVGTKPLYMGDALLRKAKPLQAQTELNPILKLNSNMLAQHELENLSQVTIHNMVYSVQLENKVPDNAVWIDYGLSHTEHLGHPYQDLKSLMRVKS